MKQKKVDLEVSAVLKLLENRAPRGTAESWDNVGLLMGKPSWKTKGAVLSIDLTAESIELAKARGFRLIINHHPCIFPKQTGIAQITSPLILDVIQSGIAVVSCHTNFDRSALEVVDVISKGLGVIPQGRLLDKPSDSLRKLVVYVPTSHLEKVREALCSAGAGEIGNYDFCTFSTQGEGTFRGSLATKPFQGRPGRLERAQEVRLETVLPRGMEQAVLKALWDSHPYEEVAFDIFPVEQVPSGKSIVKGLGYGFWGDLRRPKSFPELARSVKTVFNLKRIWVTGTGPLLVRRVGFAPGKGASFVNAAASAGCDVFITGETGYHSALAAANAVKTGRPMWVMELGHRQSEKFFLQIMKEWISETGLKTVILDKQVQAFY